MAVLEGDLSTRVTHARARTILLHPLPSRDHINTD